MSNYFQTVNPSGDVLIDDTTARLALRRVITLSSAYQNFVYEYGRYSDDSYFRFYAIPMQDGEVVCFAHSNNTSQPITCFNSDNNHCVAIFYSKGSSPVPGDVKVYIFGIPSQTDAHSGLSIYNADGVLIFSSEQQLLYSFKGTYSTRLTWAKINSDIPSSITSTIDNNCAMNCSCYIGSGNPLGEGCFYPILFSSYLTLSLRWIDNGYYGYSGSKHWDWSRCGPVSVGCTIIAIDISRYPSSL